MPFCQVCGYPDRIWQTLQQNQSQQNVVSGHPAKEVEVLSFPEKINSMSTDVTLDLIVPYSVMDKRVVQQELSRKCI